MRIIRRYSRVPYSSVAPPFYAAGSAGQHLPILHRCATSRNRDSATTPDATSLTAQDFFKDRYRVRLHTVLAVVMVISTLIERLATRIRCTSRRTGARGPYRGTQKSHPSAGRSVPTVVEHVKRRAQPVGCDKRCSHSKPVPTLLTGGQQFVDTETLARSVYDADLAARGTAHFMTQPPWHGLGDELRALEVEGLVDIEVGAAQYVAPGMPAPTLQHYFVGLTDEGRLLLQADNR